MRNHCFPSLESAQGWVLKQQSEKKNHKQNKKQAIVWLFQINFVENRHFVLGFFVIKWKKPHIPADGSRQWQSYSPKLETLWYVKRNVDHLVYILTLKHSVEWSLVQLEKRECRQAHKCTCKANSVISKSFFIWGLLVFFWTLVHHRLLWHLVTVSLTVSILAWVERINVRAKCLSQRQNADSGHNSNPDLSISNPAM